MSRNIPKSIQQDFQNNLRLFEESAKILEEIFTNYQDKDITDEIVKTINNRYNLSFSKEILNIILYKGVNRTKFTSKSLKVVVLDLLNRAHTYLHYKTILEENHHPEAKTITTPYINTPHPIGNLSVQHGILLDFIAIIDNTQNYESKTQQVAIFQNIKKRLLAEIQGRILDIQNNSKIESSAKNYFTKILTQNKERKTSEHNFRVEKNFNLTIC